MTQRWPARASWPLAVEIWCGKKMGHDKGPPDLILGLLQEPLIGEICASPLLTRQVDGREAGTAGDGLVITEEGDAWEQGRDPDPGFCLGPDPACTGLAGVLRPSLYRQEPAQTKNGML